eukprot:COSAG02_NODE_1248_length_13631_cov_11.854197_2_plen_81_part_00
MEPVAPILPVLSITLVESSVIALPHPLFLQHDSFRTGTRDPGRPAHRVSPSSDSSCRAIANARDFEIWYQFGYKTLRLNT